MFAILPTGVNSASGPGPPVLESASPAHPGFAQGELMALSHIGIKIELNFPAAEAQRAA